MCLASMWKNVEKHVLICSLALRMNASTPTYVRTDMWQCNVLAFSFVLSGSISFCIRDRMPHIRPQISFVFIWFWRCFRDMCTLVFLYSSGGRNQMQTFRIEQLISLHGWLLIIRIKYKIKKKICWNPMKTSWKNFPFDIRSRRVQNFAGGTITCYCSIQSNVNWNIDGKKKSIEQIEIQCSKTTPSPPPPLPLYKFNSWTTGLFSICFFIECNWFCVPSMLPLKKKPKLQAFQ